MTFAAATPSDPSPSPCDPAWSRFSSRPRKSAKDQERFWTACGAPNVGRYCHEHDINGQRIWALFDRRCVPLNNNHSRPEMPADTPDAARSPLRLPDLFLDVLQEVLEHWQARSHTFHLCPAGSSTKQQQTGRRGGVFYRPFRMLRLFTFLTFHKWRLSNQKTE